MNYELTHDTIAKQIYQKASNEARTRRKVEKYIRERYEAYQTRGARLTQDDIDYITPYLAQVNIKPEEEQFVENERKALIAGRRRQRMIVVGVIAVLVLFLGFAIERWIDANHKTEIANQKTEESDSLRLEAFASDSIAQLKAKAALLSDSLARLQADTARMEKENAEQALESFQSALKDVVRLKIREIEGFLGKSELDKALATYQEIKKLSLLPGEVNEIGKKVGLALLKDGEVLASKGQIDLALERHKQAVGTGVFSHGLVNEKKKILEIYSEHIQGEIRELNYDSALAKYQDAYWRDILPKRLVAKGMMELAFFYGEIGQGSLAYGLADTTATLLGLKETSLRGSEKMNDYLKSLNPDWYEKIYDRYYPKMVKIKGGQFQMGSEDGGSNEKPVHLVELSDYELATTEVTIWQYNLYRQATDQDSIVRINRKAGDNPVIYVSWYDAVRYANWVSLQMGLDSAYSFRGDSVQIDYKVNAYRLPTEAQWEYAAAGGSRGYAGLTRRYEYAGTSNEDSLEYYAWFNANSGSRTQAVGRKLPNPLSLYDMSGNAWEWCQDWYNDSYIYADSIYRDSIGLYIDPVGPIYRRSRRVLRGGSWRNAPLGLRVSYRDCRSPDLRGRYIGFRLARTP